MEKISKFISYILRHNPREENLYFDEFGWISINEFLKVLRKNNIEFNVNDIISLNNSFEKVRWEIDLENNKIRASHGHSFPVILEDKIENPPKILFHGTSTKSLKNILKKGILPMQRSFVHLSDDINIAFEIGKRYGKEIILEVDSDKMSKDSQLFYKTQNDIWLTEKVDLGYINIEPWSKINFEEAFLRNQLINEISNKQKHQLFGIVENLKPFWKNFSNDDVLFVDEISNKFYNIHLTFSYDNNENYPKFEIFDSFENWAEKILYRDQKEFYS